MRSLTLTIISAFLLILILSDCSSSSVGVGEKEVDLIQLADTEPINGFVSVKKHLDLKVQPKDFGFEFKTTSVQIQNGVFRIDSVNTTPDSADRLLISLGLDAEGSPAYFFILEVPSSQAIEKSSSAEVETTSVGVVGSDLLTMNGNSSLQVGLRYKKLKANLAGTKLLSSDKQIIMTVRPIYDDRIVGQSQVYELQK